MFAQKIAKTMNFCANILLIASPNMATTYQQSMCWQNLWLIHFAIKFLHAEPSTEKYFDQRYTAFMVVSFDVAKQQWHFQTAEKLGKFFPEYFSSSWGHPQWNFSRFKVHDDFRPSKRCKRLPSGCSTVSRYADWNCRLYRKILG